MSLKLIFAGTPDFAIPTLQALFEFPYDICAIYTQPDRPAGRGRKLTASPVKNFALTHHIPVYQPISLRDPAEQQRLRDLQADVMIVIAYGLLLPPAVLTAPKFGCMNVHASLLPRWRGAAPIQRAILAGDTTTGITIMQMDQGLDTGAMLAQTSCAIHPTDTAKQLHDQLANIGASALIDTLKKLQQNSLTAKPQDETHACYATKLNKAEALINWQDSAVNLARCVRAFNPWPIAHSVIEQHAIRIWQAQALTAQASATPGTIININAHSIDVATGDGVLQLQHIQLPGGKPLAIADVLNAHHPWLTIGAQFTC